MVSLWTVFPIASANLRRLLVFCQAFPVKYHCFFASYAQNAIDGLQNIVAFGPLETFADAPLSRTLELECA